MPKERSSTHDLRATESDAGLRLDKFLATALPDISRSRLKALIEAGHVGLQTFSGKSTAADPAYRIRPGDRVMVDIPPPADAAPSAQSIPLDIVYEDEHLLVLDKPPGLVVHPAPGNPDRTLVNALLAHCGGSLSGIGGVKRPGIVHRLDKDTSGLLLVAKHDVAHSRLSADFSRHVIERAYLALVWGTPLPPEGDIDASIGRSRTNRKKMAVTTSGGKTAHTHYKTLKRFLDAVSLVECRLKTGRTHQIRVHMASIGHPVVGDPTYGRGRRKPPIRISKETSDALAAFPRQALHARTIGFIHPVTKQILKFERQPPPDMKALIDNLEQY